MLKFPKSKLDEMQEKRIAKVESIGLYIAVIGLLLATFFQGIFCTNVSEMIGEVIITEVICLYIIFSYLKNGVWDRFFMPGIKNHLAVSLVSGTVVAVFSCILAVMYGPIHSIVVDTLLAFVSVFAFVFLGDLVLERVYKFRKKKLEGTPEQKELAAKVHVSSETIRDIQEGTYNPSIRLCCEICRATGKTLDELFWMEEESNNMKRYI